MADLPQNPRNIPSAQPDTNAGQPPQRVPLAPPSRAAQPVPEHAPMSAAPEASADPQQAALQQGVACACAALGQKPDFPSAKNRAARLANLAKQGETPHGRLTHDDYAVALGKPNQPDPAAEYQVADALAKAWAADGDVLRYQSDESREATAPPGMNSPAAAGWQPTAQVQMPLASRAYARAEPEQANQLFEAYGASYAEAYAAALSVAFSEAKPLPDDATGDVTGLISSIMHTPSGEPLLLGSVYVEDKRANENDDDLAAIADEPPISTGRKVARSLLLTLGAGALAVAGLYFTGYLL